MDDLLVPNGTTTGPPELIVADRFRAFREHMAGPNYPAGSPPIKDRDKQRAERLIDALDAAGYVIVPKEPTETMIEAAWKAVDRLPVNKDCDETIVSFRAMIAAAQTQRSRHPEG